MSAGRTKSPPSTLGRYFSEIRNYKPLSREEEIAHGRRIAQGSEDSVQDLVLSNLRFVVRIAMEYRDMGLPLEDLFNEGNVGLLEAAHRYDHTKGFKFITYASWWIRKSIIEALATRRLVRVPGYQVKKYMSQRARMEMEHEKHAVADSGPDGECDTCGNGPVSPLRPVVSLDENQGEYGETLMARLMDESAVDPEEASLRLESLLRLEESLSYLKPRERRVLALRFGLRRGDGDATLKQIGDELGLTRERIRQIQQEALEKLRARMTNGRVVRRAGAPRRRRGNATRTDTTRS